MIARAASCELELDSLVCAQPLRSRALVRFPSLAAIRFSLENGFFDRDGTARDLVMTGDGEDQVPAPPRKHGQPAHAESG